MEYLAVFVFGLIVGSFLNVVILRFNTGMTVSDGRSRCFSCGEELTWSELVPVLSYAFQGGACRKCGSRISPQYPLVEIAGGMAFIAAYTMVPGALSGAMPFAAFALTAILLCLYVVIVAYDLKHKIIPDFFSYLAGFAALGLVAVDSATTGSVDFMRVIGGPALFLFFWFFWKVSKGRWMGLGDGKLALSIGWTLGLVQGLAALLISFWAGAVVSLAAMGYQRVSKKGREGAALGMKSEIPFGPFLVIGFLVVFFGFIDMQSILAYLAL
ncbi:MAG TPA: prepilin peptidase [Candidatus Paceibacterota bacterium]|nr:prepilin peptidase [Candidatus Paceibacterota bacterium]